VDQLADLRDQFDVKKDDLKPLASAKGDGDTPRAERSLITARTGTLTGGINTAGVSRGFGSGSGTLDGHGTTRMQVPLGGSGSGSSLTGGSGDNVSRAGGGKKASRSQEEIELVFDRNKAAIYALYSGRAARVARQGRVRAHHRALGRDHRYPHRVERAQGSRTRAQAGRAHPHVPVRGQGRRSDDHDQADRVLPGLIRSPNPP
jgi:hypothetical protein